MIMKINTQRFGHCMLRVIIALFLMANLSKAKDETSPLTFLGSPILIVEPTSNSATKLIRLRNNSSESLNILLHADVFKSKITGKPLEAKIVFAGIEDKEAQPIYKLSKPLQPGEVLFMKVEVTNLWESGESEAILYNNGAKVGTLTALKYRLPFNVKLDSSRHESSKVMLKHKNPAELHLKNNDQMTYLLEWELIIDGKIYRSKSEIAVPPGEGVSITFTPPAPWFTSRFKNLFKEEIKEGTLVLFFKSKKNNNTQYLIRKGIPIKAHLNYWSEGMQQLVGNLIMFLVLAVGGLFSLALSNWIPNHLRHFDFKEKLDLLANKIRDLSQNIDSRLRVQVRFERYLIDKKLGSRKLYSPQLAEIFTQCNQGIEKLNKKIELLKQIDSIHNCLAHVHSSNALSTIITQVEETLTQASELLRQSELSETDFQTAHALISEARLKADKIGSPDQNFALDLTNRIKCFKEEFSSDGTIGSSPVFKDIAKELPVLFEVLNVERYLDPAKIFPDEYFQLDIISSKLDIIRDYVRRYKSLTQGNVQNENLDRIKQLLLDYLKRDSRRAIRHARLLVQQMKEGIYHESIREAIKSGEKAVSIEIDPGLVRVYQPVQLSVRFSREELNQSAASNEFRFVWKFGNQNLIERGKQVSHFFPETKNYSMELEFEDTEGQPIEDQNGQMIKLREEINVKPRKGEWLGKRARVELVRLIIALSIALIGLLAGAKEQILKMDVYGGFIAVFLLGFGADTIKNILTQRQRESQ